MSSKPVPKPPEPTLPRSPSRAVRGESPDNERVRSKRNSAEYRAFRKCFADLAGASGILDPGWLADQLFSKELIGSDIRREAHNQAIPERVKVERLLSAVEDQIVTSPATTFREFLDVLQNEPSLQRLATRLENTHHELVGVPQHREVEAADELNAEYLSSELATVTDWKKLGINLGVSKNDLDEIQHDNQWDYQRKLEMLKLWLQCTPNATWEDVVIALQKMGKNALAEGIHRKYIREGGKL